MTTDQNDSPQEAPEQLRAQVIERVRHMARVPLMPACGPRMIELARMPIDDVDVSELDRLINQEPGVASRLMRIANSPYYGASQAITTVRHAIITIGLENVLNLALATTVMGRFEQKSRMQRLDPKTFWLHSVAVGAAARAATAHAGVAMLAPAEVALAGLLHDIGKNLFIARFPEQYDACLAEVQRTRRSLPEIENEVFGIGHDEVGGLLAEEWKLPTFLAQAVRWHHAPGRADEAYIEGIRLVRWADRFARIQQFGQGGNREPEAEPVDDQTPDGILDTRLANQWTSIADTVEIYLATLGAEPDNATPLPRLATLEAVPEPAPKPKSKPSFFQRLFGRK